ncbi:hypothetical protein ACHAPT_006851 [Fusarium lateritium]
MRQLDFQHTECLTARISLAKATRQMIKSLYGRARVTASFLQRVQHALRDLKQWLQDLPDHLQLASGSTHSKPVGVQSLHLAFNQSIILATRPMLLHLLSKHKECKGATPATAERLVSDNVQTLAETCVRCARHSYSAIVECWIEGSFRTFDYFNTQYLFSAATILAISSLVSGPEGAKDREDFDFASQLLLKLRESGSFAAMEFCRHIEALKMDIQDFSSDGQPLPGGFQDSGSAEGLVQHTTTGQLAQFITSGMALAEPSLEAFLHSEQSLPDLDFFLDDTELGSLYWPMSDSI